MQISVLSNLILFYKFYYNKFLFCVYCYLFTDVTGCQGEVDFVTIAKLIYC